VRTVLDGRRGEGILVGDNVRLTTLVVFASALLQAGHLFAWTPPQRVDRRPEGYVVYLHDIAVGRDGTPNAVWSECKAGTYYEKTMFARRTDDSWTTPLNVSRDSGDIRTPAIVLDGNGDPSVVWSEASYGRMRYVRRLGDTWSLPKLCFANSGQTPRLASDSRGRVHLLFEDMASQGGIWYSYYIADADSWMTPARVALGTWWLGWSDLAVDRNDHLHAVWMDYGTNGLDYACNDGTGWSAQAPLPDPAPNDQSCEPRIAVDTAARPHVVWQERSGGYWLYYSCRDADSWTSPARLSPQNTGPPVTCTDNLSRIYVVYGWYDGLRCVVRTDTGWSTPEQVSDTVSLEEIAADGRLVHVVWREQWRIYYSNNGVPGVSGANAGLRLRSLGLRVTTAGHGCLVSFSLGAECRVTLSILDVAGRRFVERDLGKLGVGTHSVPLSLDSVPAGLYFGLLRAGNVSQVAKFTKAR